jgi:hypothetical protein
MKAKSTTSYMPACLPPLGCETQRAGRDLNLNLRAARSTLFNCGDHI